MDYRWLQETAVNLHVLPCWGYVRGCNNAGMSKQASGLDRRGFLGVCSMVGLGQTLLPGALFTLATQAKAQSSPIVGGSEVKASTDAMPKITPEMIDAAAVIAGISVTDRPVSHLPRPPVRPGHRRSRRR